MRFPELDSDEDQRLWLAVKERWPAFSRRSKQRLHSWPEFQLIKHEPLPDSIEDFNPMPDVEVVYYTLENLWLKKSTGEKKPIFKSKFRMWRRKQWNKAMRIFGLSHRCLPEKQERFKVVKMRAVYCEPIDTLVHSRPHVDYHWWPVWGHRDAES